MSLPSGKGTLHRRRQFRRFGKRPCGAGQAARQGSARRWSRGHSQCDGFAGCFWAYLAGVIGAKPGAAAHFGLAPTRIGRIQKLCVSPPDNIDGLSSCAAEGAGGPHCSPKLTELERTVAALREEDARLKGLKGRPDIKAQRAWTGPLNRPKSARQERSEWVAARSDRASQHR